MSFKNFFKKKNNNITPVEVNTASLDQCNESQQPGIFNLPPDWDPIDSVFDTTRIPGTNLDIGTGARVVETNRQERIELNQRRGIRAGCEHFIYAVEEIGGSCPFCTLELLDLIKQGILTQTQAEERSLYCIKCSSFCMACFRTICSAHTQLLQHPNGNFIMLCPVCYQKATHKNLLFKILSLLFGK